MTYSAPVTINAAALFQPWNQALAEINATMRSFGMEQTVVARTEIGAFTFQAEKHLSIDELETIRAKAEAIARESQPTWDFRFGRLELL